jgi:hypothetical protein
VGQTLLLLNYEHQPADSPYRSRHAILVSEAGMMTAAELTPSAELAPVIEQMLGNPQVSYLHAHNPGRGCYAARIDRV